jgi:hypothetical protein
VFRRFTGRHLSSIKVPLPNTYWVDPGRLLAGEYPYGVDDADTRGRLERLREAGIDHFIDLTQPDEWTEYRHLLPARTKYRRCPIQDTEVPDEIAHMQEIQAEIRSALTVGSNVYVHCRAGIGRTGIVVGCYLVETGLTGKAALKQLNVLWRQSARAKSWPKVPQTHEQAVYIQRWPHHRQMNDEKSGPNASSV